MLSRLRRAIEGLLWLLRPTGLRKAFAELSARLQRMEARLIETESRVNLLVSPTNVPVEVHGHYLYLDRHDSLGLALHHTHEPFQTSLLDRLVRPGDTVVDAGAHIGYYALLFARRVGPSGRVIAFEPSPHAHVLLRRNLIANGYPEVAVHEAVLHRERARLPFFTCEDGLAGGSVHHPGGGWAWERLELEALPLDSVIPPGGRVNFVKMDIQGAEGLALAGMRRCLEDNPAVRLLIEFWPRGLVACGTQPAQLLADLALLGFTFQDVREAERELVPATAAELLSHYPERSYIHTNLVCERRA